MIDRRYIPNMQDLHRLIVWFTQVHVENAKDDIGPNKPDAPFFEAMARKDAIDPVELVECANRLHKYRQTQLPQIGSIAGYPADTDWGMALDVLRGIGEEAKRIQKEYEEKVKATYVLEETLHEEGVPWPQWQVRIIDVPELSELIKFAEANPDKFPPNWAQHMFQQTVEIAESRNRMSKVRSNNRVIEAERYTRRYYYHGDREEKRIKITLPVRDDSFRDKAKAICGFPTFMWDRGEYCLSLKDEQEAIDKLVRGFNDLGLKIPYNFDALLKLRGDAAEPEDESTYYTAKLHKGDVMVKIPKRDAALRRIVKEREYGIGGKWNKENLSWVVPMSKVPLLLERVEDDHPVLCENIRAIPEVHTHTAKRAERVAISDVATLGDDDERVKEMEARLSEVFPPGHKLYPFQYVGVRFAELAGGRALIGDDMGLGKTMQSLGYVALHPEHHPALIVCPAIVKYNWFNETQKWLGSTYTSGVINNGNSPIPDTDIVIINYSIVNKQKDKLLERGFKTIVCDESHYLKNHKAARTKATLEIAEECESVLFLSGTPVTNRPKELWTTLTTLRPTEWRGKWYDFTERYCDPQERHVGRGRYVRDVSGSSNEKELHGVLRELMIRRLKKEVLPELPDKVREYVKVKVSSTKIKEYKRLSETLWREAQTGKPGAVLNMLTELRHECGRMKAKFAADYVTHHVEQAHSPVVVFAHHKDVLVEMYNMIREKKKEDGGRFIVTGITGETPANDRTKIVERFQEGRIDVLLASTTAANTGITLTRADTVFFVERDWTPAVEEQAEDRVNRIGQEKGTVWAKYLTLEGTIDETFNEVVEGKRAVIQAFLDGGDKQERYHVGEELIKAMVAKGELPAEALEIHMRDKKKPRGYE